MIREAFNGREFPSGNSLASAIAFEVCDTEVLMADYAMLLRDHVTLKCRCIDRIFLQAYVSKLQSVGQVCRFLHSQRGFSIPSSAAFGQIGSAYVAEIHRWAKANSIRAGNGTDDIAFGRGVQVESEAELNRLPLDDLLQLLASQ